MFADESRRETADYKFFYEDGILKKYGKELTGDDVTGEYIGIGRFSAAFMPEFICRMEEMIDRQEHGVWWENVVYSMTGSSRSMSRTSAGISGRRLIILRIMSASWNTGAWRR